MTPSLGAARRLGGSIARFDGTITRLGIALRPDGSPYEKEGVLNPASATARDGTLMLYPRAVAEGNVSRVGLCRGTRVGDELKLVTPRGLETIEVLDVSYPAPA